MCNILLRIENILPPDNHVHLKCLCCMEAPFSAEEILLGLRNHASMQYGNRLCLNSITIQLSRNLLKDHSEDTD